MQSQLRWAGHVIKMGDDRISEIHFYISIFLMETKILEDHILVAGKAEKQPQLLVYLPIHSSKLFRFARIQ